MAAQFLTAGDLRSPSGDDHGLTRLKTETDLVQANQLADCAGILFV
jgi:hypothetical protein